MQLNHGFFINHNDDYFKNQEDLYQAFIAWGGDKIGNCGEGYGIEIGIGIDQERSESVSESNCEFSWSQNRYQNCPDMDKVSLSESEPKILVSPAPGLETTHS